MEGYTVYLLLGLLLHSHVASSIWRCTQDADCDSRSGSVCHVASGACVCAPGQQAVLSGTACVDVAPYLTSTCVEDHQCSRLFTGFECQRLNATDLEGYCFCSSGHHYVNGRCWRSVGFGASCTNDEQCIGEIRSPFSMSCSGTCQCAEGFYERQRGDCRKAGLAVGDGCVLDMDCQFEGGVCDVSTLLCNTTSASTTASSDAPVQEVTQTSVRATVVRVECNTTTPCESPFECSNFGVCICPVGYYESADGLTCLAELGSPSESAQCTGFQAVIRDGVCSCQPNFFYEENMRDCIRATRRISDSCVNDFNCHTFGPGTRCGPPQDPWGFRTCECIPELAVWDAALTMCRFFSGIGGSCEVESDCQAGQLEIQCVKNETGHGVCSCPDDLTEHEGLCLTTGVELGGSCQHSLECTGTANTVCNATSLLCACADGYQALNDACAPIIGGTCSQDSDCVIDNTECRSSDTGSTCQCQESFLAYDDICWPEVDGYNANCSVTAQCVDAMGISSSCVDNRCVCAADYHFRDGNCWPITHLLESCSRVSECYLSEESERVVCRNGRCQCDFDYVHSEQLNTCLSSPANAAKANILLLLLATLVLSDGVLLVTDFVHTMVTHTTKFWFK